MNKAVKEREKVKERIDQLLVILREINEEYELAEKLEDLLTANVREMKVKSEIKKAREDYLRSLKIETHAKQKELVYIYFKNSMVTEEIRAKTKTKEKLDAHKIISKMEEEVQTKIPAAILYSIIIEEAEKIKKIMEQQSFLEKAITMGMEEIDDINDEVISYVDLIKDFREYKKIISEEQETYQKTLLDIVKEFKALKETKNGI